MSSLFDIYSENMYLINCKENLNKENIELLTYISKNNLLDKQEKNILFISDFMRRSMDTFDV